ncbi:MAG: flavin reductase family protein [Planctomycetes bacterium]|nr:flavin reductase family protein [Planctomycetota bacterium]
MYHEARGSEALGFLATKPLVFITTLHATGVVNAGVFGAYTNLSAEHVGAAVCVESHTYANILRQKEFVINVPGADLVKSIAVIADDVPPDKSEVEEAGLTLKPGVSLDTPSIAECAASVEFAFDREVHIGYHGFLIGKALGGWIKEEFRDVDGKIDIFKAAVMKDFKYPRPLYVLPGRIVEG